MEPTKLNARRMGYNFPVLHIDSAGNEQKYLMTANHDTNFFVKEVFCANPMTGSDMEAILTDACIMISLLLQSGWELDKLSSYLGERRPERGSAGPSSSVLGSIVKGALVIHNELSEKREAGMSYTLKPYGKGTEDEKS